MQNETAKLWDVEITARSGRPNPEAMRVAGLLHSLDDEVRRSGGVLPPFHASRGFVIETSSDEPQLRTAVEALLVDPVVEELELRPLEEVSLDNRTVTVLRKPGVMDPVADSAESAFHHLGIGDATVRQYQRCRFVLGVPPELAMLLAQKALANEAIEQIVLGNFRREHFAPGGDYRFEKVTVPIRELDDAALLKLSETGMLYLILDEMKAIQQHFRELGRDPTDVELETIAQTWSEHCSHKTFRGPYTLNGKPGKSGLLKDTIMHATKTLNKDWCVSVFTDNAGVVKFDDEWNVCFKVETHNRPSAIEPYGGANTGLGGVIRDVLGVGLGAKPICNTDVFCVAPPNIPSNELPPGVLHPERVLRGIVSGVRDYGNRMGIPTVNGAVVCDPRYVGNPLVFCGTVGILPAEKSFKEAKPGDLIVAIGGRTGRDGIHGATFSSGELTEKSEQTSGGAVQIGNAITEKKVAEAVLAARDLGLFNAITDCGAGGFSSAVGEMGAEIGARVELESAPLKYSGLSYTEIWISEAQERMVLAVPPEKFSQLQEICANEDVECVSLGVFEATGRLKLNYQGQEVGDLDMHFLHEGRPEVLREGVWKEPEPRAFVSNVSKADFTDVLFDLLGSWNIASKEWIIRQYDHEVQAGTVIKPLVGIHQGPGDAAVIAPVPASHRGLAIACGLQPRFGDGDPYRMAAAAIDEAIRNIVAVGGDPDRTAILDNFCWGNIHRPETFGQLVRAAEGCRDAAIAFGTPFISGKDSLNNEFAFGGERIVIPPTLLISAMAIVPDFRKSLSMELKSAGNQIVVVGITKNEMSGSHFNLVTQSTGGELPTVEAYSAVEIYRRVHKAINRGLIRSCHDCSEGGLAVALAEMAFAGEFGLDVDLSLISKSDDVEPIAAFFSESCSRLVLEVAAKDLGALRQLLGDISIAQVGEVKDEPQVVLRYEGKTLVEESTKNLRDRWRRGFEM